MTFIQFLIDTPVVAFLLLLVLLVTIVPLATLFVRKQPKRPGHPDEVRAPVKEPPTTRFLGTQMDMAILIFGLLMLLGVIGWVKKIFFG